MSKGGSEDKMDVKISADLNKAIDQLSEKLGMAANEMLPHYTRLFLIRGIVSIISGVVLAAASLLLFEFY